MYQTKVKHMKKKNEKVLKTDKYTASKRITCQIISFRMIRFPFYYPLLPKVWVLRSGWFPRFHQHMREQRPEWTWTKLLRLLQWSCFFEWESFLRTRPRKKDWGQHQRNSTWAQQQRKRYRVCLSICPMHWKSYLWWVSLAFWKIWGIHSWDLCRFPAKIRYRMKIQQWRQLCHRSRFQRRFKCRRSVVVEWPLYKLVK